MKISLNQLKTYVDIDVPVEELCDKMVMAGFEVESIDNLADTMKNVVAAKILKITPHENSDHLQICQMDIGESEPLQIVTGADNIFEGAIVPAALHNSLLPNGMEIKKGKLRGVESNGMLCSGEELCLKDYDYPGAEVYGILILKDDVAVGTDMRDVLGLDDYIIDFKITANRPDCNCVLGVAKEIGVVLKKEFHPPVPTYKTCGGDINDYVSVEVRNFDICPRYISRAVKNLRIKESPDWMKKALKASGMRPINNIVDITNFVMLETGQPMHAFDRRDLKDSKIIVRNAADGEKLTTLDEKEHTLSSSMLVIADADNPTGLAGIMGGLNSEIKEDTTELVFECAKFRRDSIRKTARALGVRTESSGRYERGIDINNTAFAMERALQLIDELDAGDIIDGVIDLNQGLPEDRIITTTVSDITALLGVDVPSDTVVEILNRLCLPTTLDGDKLTVTVPSIRDDIEGRADLAEEVMRIYGYDHIVGTTMRGAVTRGRKLDSRIKDDLIKATLSSAGCREITTYSFIASKAIDTLSLSENDERRTAIKLLNPLGDEYSTLRTQLATSMLTVLATNANRKNSEVRLFEISKRFVPKALPLTEQPLELGTLAIGAYGSEEDFFTMKGLVEQVLDTAGINYTFERSGEPYLHPGRQASALVEGQEIATFGEVHPTTAATYGIDCRCYLAEIKLDLLYSFDKEPIIYQPLPKFPAVLRDFALLCDISLPIGDMEKAIKSAAGKICEKVKLFDVYIGSQIPEGKKSVAFSVSLRSLEGTLSDEQIEAATKKIIKSLDSIGAQLR
ncbi:MAG: phenylalanine--tRNA ligase subunit beta [Clostridia bacterium]|nr:phenylalanine--tRNA ligase subunit beta [Clostridia bacterium]